MITEGSEGPLETNIVLLSVLILHKFVIFLVYRVVGQVHVAIVLIELCRIRLRGKSGEAFFENVDAQWLIRCNYYINAQVELMTVNQQRICDVSRDYRRFIDIELVKTLNDMNAASLR